MIEFRKPYEDGPNFFRIRVFPSSTDSKKKIQVGMLLKKSLSKEFSDLSDIDGCRTVEGGGGEYGFFGFLYV